MDPISTPDPSSSGTPRGRLLVADDEPHIRRILTTLLEMSEFVVDSVSDGTAALELLGGSVHYDLILLDIMMPGASGLEVLQQIRSLPSRADVPVVILTAKGQDADRDEAFELGAADFVTKPFSPKKLLARIDELLDA